MTSPFSVQKIIKFCACGVDCLDLVSGEFLSLHLNFSRGTLIPGISLNFDIISRTFDTNESNSFVHILCKKN